MPMRATDRIMGEPRGSAMEVMAYAHLVGSERLEAVSNYLSEVFTLAPAVGIDPAIVAVQSALECHDWRDRWWRERLNPAGIGITGDPQQNEASMTWRSGADSARGQIVHLWLYARGRPLHPFLVPYEHLDPRAGAIPAGNLGSCQTIADLGGKWAVQLDYGMRIENRADDVFADLPDQKEAPMGAGLKAYRFDGLAADVQLPVDINVHRALVSRDYCGWVRSCSPNHVQKTTFHDTGTPGSRASGQASYLNGGPKNQDGTIRQVGFNFAVDDRDIYFLTPLDEDTWAAGTAEGNDRGWHIEMCFGGSIDFEKSLRNCIMLHAALIAAKGWSPDTALVQHNDWSGKDCPRQIRSRGRWPEVQRRVADQVRVILQGGGTPLDGVIDVGDTVAASVVLNFREGPSLTGAVLGTLAIGAEAVVRADPVAAEGYQWLQVAHTFGDGVTRTGYVAMGTAESPYVVLVKDAEVKPPTKPVYPAPLAIPELVEHIGRVATPMPHRLNLSDGRVAIPVYDRVEAMKATPRLRDLPGGEVVGPDIVKGEQFDVSFLLLSAERADYYVTPFWTRVAADDCLVVSDVPKHITPAPGAAE